MGPLTDENIGQAIQAGRQRAGILQSALSERLAAHGLTWSQATISKVERGDRPVRAIELPAVAAALDMSVDDLFTPWESGLQLRLRDATAEMVRLDDGLKAVREEYARVSGELTRYVGRLQDARNSYEALRVLIDFTRGALETERVSWTAAALVEYWTNGIEPRLNLGDLVDQLGDPFASSVRAGGVVDLASAFPGVQFGGDQPPSMLTVQRAKQ